MSHLDAPTESDFETFEIVGLVADTLTADRGDDLRPLFFRSLTQAGRRPTTVVAHSSTDAEGLVGAMQQELRAIDPSLPVIRARTMQRQLDDSLVVMQAAVTFLVALAVVGLALACVGLYAVVSFAVAQRTREIGIRTALGARTTQVTWAVARDVAMILFVAVGFATVLSFAGVLVLKSVDLSSPAPGVHLNVPTVDATALPVLAALMLLVGLAAAYLPARRAAKVDPLSVLRHE